MHFTPIQRGLRARAHGALRLGSLAFALAAIAHPAAADVGFATYIDSQHYNYNIIHMPDLDQKRFDLPGNGGMYCVPTAAVNLFAYASNHGFASSILPDWTWSSQSHYDDATEAIELMGFFMATDAEDGTTCCVDLALDIFEETNPYLKHKVRYLHEDYSPGVANMTKMACQGWVMSFVYGKYVPGTIFEGYPIMSRAGGHAVTLIYSYRDGTARLLTYRDPVSDDSLNQQSEFIGKLRGPFDYKGWFPNAGLRTLAGLFYSDAGNPRIIDKHYGVRPIYGIAFDGSPALAGGGGFFTRMDPIPFEGSQNIALPQIELSSGLLLEDFQINPAEEDALVIARSSILALPSRLRTLDLTTGQLTILDPAPNDLKRMDINRFDQVFTFDGDDVCYRLGQDGVVQHSNTIGDELSDVAVDDAADVVWFMSVEKRLLFKVSMDLSETLQSFTVPANCPMDGEGHLVIDPTTGIPYIKTDGSVKFWRITPPQAAVGAIATAINLPGADEIQSMFMGEDGRLYVNDGVLHTYIKDPRGSWTLDPTSPFNGEPGGTHFAMLRSTTNYDPDIHSGPEWQNIDPSELDDFAEELADCDADFNGDRIVDGADLGLMLGGWGDATPYDINQDGTVDGADLGLLLGLWGDCQ